MHVSEKDLFTKTKIFNLVDEADDWSFLNCCVFVEKTFVGFRELVKADHTNLNTATVKEIMTEFRN